MSIAPCIKRKELCEPSGSSPLPVEEGLGMRVYGACLKSKSISPQSGRMKVAQQFTAGKRRTKSV
jgi:hypothetical protein